MAGTSRADIEGFYGELSANIASQWGEDMMATVDDKLHMPATAIQTVAGPINFSTTGTSHTFGSPLNVTGAGINTFGGPVNATSTGVNTFAGPFNATATAINTFGGPFNATSTGINTWAGPMNVATSSINTFAGPINATHQTSMNTFEGPMDLNGTMNVEGVATFQAQVVLPSSNNLTSLTTGEISQLANIGAATVSAAQWGYLGGMDQGVAKASSVTFNTVQSDNLRANGNTNHRILMDAADDRIHIYPGDDPTDHHFVLWSNGTDFGALKFYPTADQMGTLGASIYEWYSVYALKVFRNGTELDAYDDLSIIEGVGVMKDTQGAPVLNDHGNPYIDPESLPDFLRPLPADRAPGKAHVELGAWTDLAIGGVKQLYRKHKTFRDQALTKIQDLEARILALEAA